MRTKNHSILFARKFFKDRSSMASIWPSSKSMVRATVREVDFDSAQVIVELGAGTGAITQAIVTKLRPTTKLIVIERDPDFVSILRVKYGRHSNIDIVHGDVRDLGHILEVRGVKQVDYFVSGLSVPLLPPDVRNQMLEAVHTYLRKDGIFSNITEVPYYYKRFYKQFFKEVHFKLVPLNIPPGGVYYCRGVEAHIIKN